VSGLTFIYFDDVPGGRSGQSGGSTNQPGAKNLQHVQKLGGLLGTLLLAAVATLAVTTATGWLHVTPVLSGSMRGAFNPGDALLTERVPLSSLHVGDVVDVNVPAQNGEPASQRVHRIVNLRHQGSAVVIRTKGDANAIADPDEITLHGDQYLMRARLPYVGWIVDFKAVNGLRLLLMAIVVLGALSLGQHLLLARHPPRRRSRHGRRRSTTGNAFAS
jgi:signal peptidase I